MEDDSKNYQIGSNTSNMEEINEVRKHQKMERKTVNRKTAVSPFPISVDALATNEIKSVTEEINDTSANNENQTTKLSPLETHIQIDENISCCNITRGRPAPLRSIPSIVKGKDVIQDNRKGKESERDPTDESCLKRTMTHCLKVLTCKEPLFSKDPVSPRTMTSKQITKIIALRFLMILHNLLTIWRVTVETNNELYWILTLTVMLQLIEMVYSLLRDLRIRKRLV